MNSPRMTKAFVAFDAYNAKDPNHETENGVHVPKELLYARRMTQRLDRYSPDAPEYIQLAVRCQHIGRWEIPRNTYPMDRKGYLQWHNQLKFHHCRIAEDILQQCGYDLETIEKVKFLLMKRELSLNPETQLLEDIICLVFIEYYLDEFAARHDEEKVIDIVRKTMKKMTPRALESAGSLSLSDSVREVIGKAAA